MKDKHLYFTVTNDLTYDQRMHRICTSLSQAGFAVTLVGRRIKNSVPLKNEAYQQKRLRCYCNKGFLFYAEYNLRLFFYLLTKKMAGICAVDLDTILPCLFVSKIKGVTRLYDAHEYFTELKEVRTRPFVQKFWTLTEKFAVPRFDHGYTVSEGLATEFKNRYNRDYRVVRNFPVLQELAPLLNDPPYLLFQGAVNEARGFEFLIPAMKQIPYRLVVCGDGNFMDQLKNLIRENGVENRVELKGMLRPEELKSWARQASLGLGFAEREGINQFHALPNKFLDYMHAGLPQVAMNFPEYQKINSQFFVAVLVDELSVKDIAAVINETMQNEKLRSMMRQNALKAREIFHWGTEEKILHQLYYRLFA